MMGVYEHNILVLRIIRDLARDAPSEAECLVAVESIVLGALLLYKRNRAQAAEILDSLTMRVIERMDA